MQLLLAEPPTRNQWQRKCSGVACFVKDYALKSYFIRLYDIYVKLIFHFCFSNFDAFFIFQQAPNQQPLWQQELYQNFFVAQPHENLLTFEGDVKENACVNFL